MTDDLEPLDDGDDDADTDLPSPEEDEFALDNLEVANDPVDVDTL